MMKNQGIGIGMILMAAVMWGTIGTLTRFLTQFGFSSLSLIFYRAFFTALIMFVYILCKDRSLLKIRLRDVWMFVGSGILSFFLFNVCYMLSIGMNSLAVSAILLYTSPVFVMLFSVVLFRERFSAKKGIALLLAVFGCVLVSLGGAVTMSLPGLLLGLASGLGYALYSIFGTIALRRYHTVTITFYTFLFAALAGLFVADFPVVLPIFAQRPEMIAVIFLFSVWVTVLPYLLYTTGMSYNNATVASIVSCIEPVVAAVLGFALFSERLSFVGITGILMVLGAIVLLNLKKKDCS